MMARISCSSTSNETSCSAFTPPNASDTLSTERTTLMPPRRSRGPPGCRGREGPRVLDPQVGGERAAAAVLVFHLRLDVHALLSAVQRLDQGAVFLADV